MNEYTYPSASDMAKLTLITPDQFKEASIANHLLLEDVPVPEKPQLLANYNQPKPPAPGPIEDLLALSQQLIRQYKMELPYGGKACESESITNNKENVPDLNNVPTNMASKLALSLNMTPRKNKAVAAAVVRGTKRAWPIANQDNEVEEFQNGDDLHNHSALLNSRNVSSAGPLENKTSFFSPAGKVPGLQKKLSLVSLLQSTPVKKATTPLKKMLKTNMAVLVQAEKQPIEIYSDNNKRTSHLLQTQQLFDSEELNAVPEPDLNSDSESDQDQDSDAEDKLACHANNIMRMAVDSTMLGSTFNASLSSHYDDSVINILQQLLMLLPHISFAYVPETEDADKSLLETMKVKWGKKGKRSLDSNRATRIEINEDDLKAAVGL